MLDVVVRFGAPTAAIAARRVTAVCDGEEMVTELPSTERKCVLRAKEGSSLTVVVQDMTDSGKLSPPKKLLQSHALVPDCLYRDPVAYIDGVQNAIGPADLQFGEDSDGDSGESGDGGQEGQGGESGQEGGEGTEPGDDATVEVQGDGSVSVEGGDGAIVDAHSVLVADLDISEGDKKLIAGHNDGAIKTVGDLVELDQADPKGIEVVHGIGPKARVEIMGVVSALTEVKLPESSE